MNDLPFRWIAGKLRQEHPLDEGVPIIDDPDLGRVATLPKLRAGYDFPCAIHKGPKGDCNEWDCKCV